MRIEAQDTETRGRIRALFEDADRAARLDPDGRTTDDHNDER